MAVPALARAGGLLWTPRLAAVLLCCGVLLVAAVCLQPTPGKAQALAKPLETAADGGRLAADDIEKALDQLALLARHFAAFAERESNGFASERWRRLSVNYAGTAEILHRLLEAKLVVIDDLPAGRATGLLYDGRIVVDSSLDGVWLAALPQAGEKARETEAAVQDLLVPALMEGLARGLRTRDWPWLADHLQALGDFDDLAEDSAARPLLARYFRAKDAYLWLAMQRIAEGNPLRRRALARRQVDIFRGVRRLGNAMEGTFGPGPTDRLRRDWTGYVSLVDGFAATRGWLLLDPTLRLTQLGAAARAELDVVDLAAAEVVASAPRTAIAAAMADDKRLVPQTPERGGARPAPVNLAAIVSQVETPTVAELALQLPLVVLALQPEYSIATAGRAATEDLAARLREALARPDPHLQLEASERALAATREELSGLQAQVIELNAALRAREVGAKGPQTPPAAAAISAAVPARPPAAVVVPLPSPAAEAAPEPSPAAPWQVYVILVVVGGLALGLLLWRRRPARVVAAAPLLLTAPGPDTALLLEPVTQKPAAPAATRPPPAPASPEPKRPAGPQAPRPTLPPLPSRDSEAARETGTIEAPLRVSGVAPATPAALATVKAASAQTAARGREADVAAQPIVQALRSGNLPHFEQLFSELTGLRSPQLQRIVYGGRGEDLLIVCRAVGVDKLLFGSIFLLTDHLRGGDADEDPARAAEVLRMFERMPPETAQKVLAKWQRNWGGRQRTRPPAGA